MASTVYVDLAAPAVDASWLNDTNTFTYPLSGVVSPVGAITPTRIGQEYLDTVLSKWWKSTALINTAWVALN